MAVLRLAKIKKGSGISFWNRFSAHDISIKMFLVYNVIPSFLVNDVINFKIYLRSPLKQWPTGREKGKMEIQKFEYLENETSFLNETKSNFHSYLRAINW